jgi:hypothetical protein
VQSPDLFDSLIAFLLFTAMDEAPKVIDVEKLGRQRPEVFASAWSEAAFATSLLLSLTMSVSSLKPTRIQVRAQDIARMDL